MRLSLYPGWVLHHGLGRDRKIRVQGRDALLAALEASPEEYLDLRGDQPEASLTEWFRKHESSLLDNFGIHMLPQLMQSPRLGKEAFREGLTWGVRSVKGARFDLLIGDRPLLRTSTPGGGYVLALPISPMRLFMIATDRHLIEKIIARDADAVVTMLNKHTVSHAGSFVFGSDSRQLALVRKLLTDGQGVAAGFGEQTGERGED